MKFSLLGFDFLGTSGPFIPSIFSLLERERLSYNCPTIVFWKQITCFVVSQVHRWTEILSQDGPYLKSHPYLVWMIYMMRLGTF